MLLSKTGTILIFVSVMIFSLCGIAQQTGKPKNVLQADPPKEEGTIDQQRATYALISAINEMQDLKDLQTRVLLAESILPLLAKSRPQSCRELLDAIFSDALRNKKELNSTSTAANLKPAADNKLNSGKTPNPDTIIRNLIKITGKFDSSLAKRYTEEYTAEKESGQKPQGPLRDELKLALATDMVESDPTGALPGPLGSGLRTTGSSPDRRPEPEDRSLH